MIDPSFTQCIREVHGEAGRAWLASLPERIRELEEAWSVQVGAPVENLTYNYVAAAARADGTPVILKLGVPSEELLREMTALRCFDGRGAVRVLEADPEQGALLLERLVPGRSLLNIADDTAIPILAAVIRRLHLATPPDDGLPSVAEWADAFAWLRSRCHGGTGPLPAPLVETAEALFRELAESSQQQTLLHADLHHDNVLASEREPWLAIDPHGAIGDPAYETGAFLRNGLEPISKSASPARAMARRVDHLAAETGFDRERIRNWGTAQAVLSAIWSLQDHDGGWEQAMACAEWLSAAR